MVDQALAIMQNDASILRLISAVGLFAVGFNQWPPKQPLGWPSCGPLIAAEAAVLIGQALAIMQNGASILRSIFAIGLFAVGFGRLWQYLGGASALV